MNRRTRTLIVMVIAVVCAALASAAVLYAVRVAAERERANRPQQAKIVVAARPVTNGVCLSQDDVAVAEWPKDTKDKVAGSHETGDAVVGRGLLVSVVQGEPLTDQKIAEKGAGCGLPAAIRKGLRAVSVKVNDVIGVAGFVVPGARVDVLVTIRQDSESTSRVVVSNVEVLTAGT